jgi:hypothetical protein
LSPTVSTYVAICCGVSYIAAMLWADTPISATRPMIHSASRIRSRRTMRRTSRRVPASEPPAAAGLLAVVAAPCGAVEVIVVIGGSPTC